MKELDNEYKRLIKMRYVLRTSKNISSKADLELKVDGISNTAGMLRKIAEDIADCLNEWKSPKKKAKKETKENGIEEGQKEAKENGIENGQKEAKENGIDEGQKEAKENGIDEGQKEAKENSIEEGQKKAKKKKAKKNGIEVGQEEEKKKKKSPCISRATLGRMMGAYGKDDGGKNARPNLDRIAKYIGKSNWDDLTAVSAEHAEWEMLCNIDIAETAIVSSMDYAGRKIGPGLHHLLSYNVKKGKIVDIRYGDGLLLKLKKHNDDDEFIIQHCDSKVLKKGWVIRIPLFYVGVNVTGFHISSRGLRMKDCYKSRDVIKSIEVGFI